MMKLSFNWFHLIPLFPASLLFYWIDNADRNSKFFPIIYHFYLDLYFPFSSVSSLDMTIFSFLFFPFCSKLCIRCWYLGCLVAF